MGMFKEFQDAIISVAMAIVGLAILSVILSKKANTVEVVKAFSNAYTSAISEAVKPITG